jgi:hypothetical protein
MPTRSPDTLLFLLYLAKGALDMMRSGCISVQTPLYTICNEPVLISVSAITLTRKSDQI